MQALISISYKSPYRHYLIPKAGLTDLLSQDTITMTLEAPPAVNSEDLDFVEAADNVKSNVKLFIKIVDDICHYFSLSD